MGVCLHGVDDLLRVVVDYDLEVVVYGPHQEVEDGDLPQAAGGLLLGEVDGADHLLADAVHCCLLMEEDAQLCSLERLAGLLNRPSNQPADPAIHQISFFVCHYRVRAVFENAPD